MFTPKIGEDDPILTNIFRMGWNHQPVSQFAPEKMDGWKTILSLGEGLFSGAKSVKLPVSTIFLGGEGVMLCSPP